MNETKTAPPVGQQAEKKMRKKKIPSTFAFWSESIQIAWLEQNGYPAIAADLRGE